MNYKSNKSLIVVSRVNNAIISLYDSSPIIARKAYEYFNFNEGKPETLLDAACALREDKCDNYLSLVGSLITAYKNDIYSSCGDIPVFTEYLFMGLAHNYEMSHKRNPITSLKSIYVVQLSNGYVKIGISYKVKTRFNSIAHGAGAYIMNEYHTAPLDKAQELERMMHKHYANNRLNGEFFDIDFDECVNLLKRKCAKLTDCEDGNE